MTLKEMEGYEFTKGAIKYISEVIFVLIILFGIVIIISNIFNINVDDSDKSSWNRSGLKIHYDAKTGIEYLSDGHGGLIKREVIK